MKDQTKNNRMNHKEIERWYRLKNLRKAIQALVLISVIALVSGLAVSRYTDDGKNEFKSSIVSDSGVKVEKFTYSSVGADQWDLDAASASVTDKMDHVELELPRIVYYGGSGGKIHLSAQTGNLDKKDGRVEARGTVSIKYKDFKFISDNVIYSKGLLEAYASDSILMEGDDLKLTGKGLKLSVDKEEIVIEQDVKASLFNVKWAEPGKKLPM